MRRRTLLGSLMALLPTTISSVSNKKNLAASSLDFNPTQISVGKRLLERNEQVIVGHGVTLILPRTPNIGDYVRIVPGDIWEKGPPRVLSDQKILGYNEALLLDSSVGISLRFQGGNKGWALWV